MSTQLTPRAVAEKDMKKAFAMEITFLATALVNGSRERAKAEGAQAVRELVERLVRQP